MSSQPSFSCRPAFAIPWLKASRDILPKSFTSSVLQQKTSASLNSKDIKSSGDEAFKGLDEQKDEPRNRCISDGAKNNEHGNLMQTEKQAENADCKLVADSLATSSIATKRSIASESMETKMKAPIFGSSKHQNIAAAKSEQASAHLVSPVRPDHSDLLFHPDTQIQYKQPGMFASSYQLEQKSFNTSVERRPFAEPSETFMPHFSPVVQQQLVPTSQPHFLPVQDHSAHQASQAHPQPSPDQHPYDYYNYQQLQHQKRQQEAYILQLQLSLTAEQARAQRDQQQQIIITNTTEVLSSSQITATTATPTFQSWCFQFLSSPTNQCLILCCSIVVVHLVRQRCHHSWKIHNMQLRSDISPLLRFSRLLRRSVDALAGAASNDATPASLSWSSVMKASLSGIFAPIGFLL